MGENIGRKLQRLSYTSSFIVVKCRFDYKEWEMRNK